MATGPKRRGISRIPVVANALDHRRGCLIVGLGRFPCALGRAGPVMAKREGDGGTPRASLPLRRVFYRADHIRRPLSLLPVRRITRTDAWCDDSHDRRYNSLIRRPEGIAEERLWRDDHLYDVIVELGWNDSPVRKGRGSAIFWHLARPGYTPTAGCLAVSATVFAKVLPRLARHCRLIIR